TMLVGFQRVGDTARDRGQRGLMKHVVYPGKQGMQPVKVGDAGLVEGEAGAALQMGDILALASEQVVDHPHLMPFVQQAFSNVRADEARAAGHDVSFCHKNFPGGRRFPQCRGCGSSVQVKVGPAAAPPYARPARRRSTPAREARCAFLPRMPETDTQPDPPTKSSGDTGVPRRSGAGPKGW